MKVFAYRRSLFVLVMLAALLLAGCNTATPVPATVAPATVAPTQEPTATPLPPTATPEPPTATPEPPTATPEPPTATPKPPTATPTTKPPTATPEPPTATPQPATPTSASASAGPQAVPSRAMNVRGGPGTNFPVIGSAAAGSSYAITGKNEDGSWYQVCCFSGDQKGWLSASLVTVQGDAAAIAVAEDIPTPEPTATTAPTATPDPNATATPTTAPAASGGSGSAGGGPSSGVLLYSVANMGDQRWELWEYNFASKASRKLFDWRTEVQYSPNYSQIAYFAWPGAVGGDQAGIWIMNSDYSNPRLVIPGGAAYPSFSPDGSRLAVTGGGIYVIKMDLSDVKRISDGEYPAWSPTSNWIAHRECVGGACGIYLTDPDSGAQQRLTSGGSDGQPAWSPNGQQLAYISQDDGNFEIYRINADGSNKVRLTNSATSDGLPVWSPDGRWIAFRSDRDGSWGIYVMRSDGSNVIKIADAAVLPVWFFEKMGWRP